MEIRVIYEVWNYRKPRIVIYPKDQKDFNPKLKKNMSETEYAWRDRPFRHLSHGTNNIRGNSEFKELKRNENYGYHIKGRIKDEWDINCWCNERWAFVNNEKSWKSFKRKKQWMRGMPKGWTDDWKYCKQINSFDEFFNMYPEYCEWKDKKSGYK